MLLTYLTLNASRYENEPAPILEQLTRNGESSVGGLNPPELGSCCLFFTGAAVASPSIAPGNARGRRSPSRPLRRRVSRPTAPRHAGALPRLWLHLHFPREWPCRS